MQDEKDKRITEQLKSILTQNNLTIGESIVQLEKVKSSLQKDALNILVKKRKD